MGNMGITKQTFSPREINTPSLLSSRVYNLSVAGYKLIIFDVSWHEYESFPWAGSSGLIYIGGGSDQARGFISSYEYNGAHQATFHWIDSIITANFRGIYFN